MSCVELHLWGIGSRPLQNQVVKEAMTRLTVMPAVDKGIGYSFFLSWERKGGGGEGGGGERGVCGRRYYKVHDKCNPDNLRLYNHTIRQCRRAKCCIHLRHVTLWPQIDQDACIVRETKKISMIIALVILIWLKYRALANDTEEPASDLGENRFSLEERIRRTHV